MIFELDDAVLTMYNGSACVYIWYFGTFAQALYLTPDEPSPITVALFTQEEVSDEVDKLTMNGWTCQ